MPLRKVWLMRQVNLPMKFHLGADGWIVGEFPSLPGCMSQGRTLDEAVLNLARAIESVLEAPKGGSNGSIAA